MASSFTERLDKVRKALEVLTGVQKTQEMQPEQFLVYAMDQITKAAKEPAAKSVARLKALGHAVAVMKDNYVDTDSESVKVPIFVDEQTTLKEQSNELSTPAKSAAMNGGGESVFEDGFVAKRLGDLEKALKAFVGKADGEGEEDEDEEEKAKKAAEAKAAGDTEEDDDTTKKGEADAGGDGGAVEDENKKTKKRGVAKNIPGGSVDGDGTFWPNDLNDKVTASLKKGEVAPESTWGNDPK